MAGPSLDRQWLKCDLVQSEENTFSRYSKQTNRSVSPHRVLGIWEADAVEAQLAVTSSKSLSNGQIWRNFGKRVKNL